MSSSYSAWSIVKLKKEAAKIEKAISLKELRERKSALAEMRAVARKHGFVLSDLLKAGEDKSNANKANGSGKRVNDKKSSAAASKPKTRLKRAKAKIKYRNPEKQQETWTGRGRQPRWVVAHLERGGTLQDIMV